MRSYCQPISMPANSSQATPSQFWCGYSILLWCSVLSSPVPVLVARRIQSVICENCLETRFSSYIRAISFRKFAVHQLDEGAFSRSQLQFIKGITCQVTKPKRLRSDHSCHIWAQNDFVCASTIAQNAMPPYSRAPHLMLTYFCRQKQRRQSKQVRIFLEHRRSTLTLDTYDTYARVVHISDVC